MQFAPARSPVRWQSPLPCSPRRAHRTKPPSRPLCAAEQNRETDQVRKARNEALAKAITILTQRAGKVSRAVGEALAKEGLLNRIANGAVEVLEDFTNPRTSLDFRTKSADDDDDPRSAAVRARDVILNDRLERRKTDELFMKAGIPTTAVYPAVLPLVPDRVNDRQSATASSSAPGAVVVPTTRLPKWEWAVVRMNIHKSPDVAQARLEDINKAKWDIVVEEAYRSQLEKQQAIQVEIERAEGTGKPTDMSDAEWEMIMQRLKAVEQAIQEQNDQVQQLTLLLQLAEQKGQVVTEAKDLAIALQQRVEATGNSILFRPPAIAPDGAGEAGVSRGMSLDSDVDSILANALSDMGLDSDGGADRVVRFTGEEFEERLGQWVSSWDGADRLSHRGLEGHHGGGRGSDAEEGSAAASDGGPPLEEGTTNR